MSDTGRILIVGVDSGIGAVAARRLREAGWWVIGTSRRGTPGTISLDLAALPERIDLPEVDVCLLCAAMTRQADCRADPERSRRVNVEAPVRLARRATEAGARVVFLSSGAVFDGTTPRRAIDEPVSPLNEYGRCKAEAEREILPLPGAAVLRLTKVLTPELPLFRGWIAALRAGRAVSAFVDMVLAPISLDDTLRVLETIALRRETGILQLSADRDVVYLDVCRHIARRLGVPESLARSATAAASGIIGEDRPRFTGLDADRAARLIGRSGFDPLDAVDRTFGRMFELETDGI